MFSTYIKIFDVNHYSFNPYSLGPLLVAVISFVFGVYLDSSERLSKNSRTLVYLALGFTLWTLAESLLLNSLYRTCLLFWGRVLFAVMAFVPAIEYHLSLDLTGRYPQKKKLVRLIYWGGFLTALLVFDQRFFVGLGRGFFGFYPEAGLAVCLIVLFLTAAFFLSLANLVQAHFREREPKKRQEIRFFMMVFLVFQLSYIDLFTSYDVTIYPAGYFVLLAFLLSMILFKWRYSYETIEEHSQKLEMSMFKKELELAKALEDLRATQVKLIETGKISALASLSAGILHQISQPVTAIHGFVRFLKKEMDPQYVFYKPITMMEEQSVYLKQMLEDLMDLVRHREIKKNNINVNDIIKRSTNLLTDELRIRRVDWELDLHEPIPMVFADGIHLQQVFMNIIINGIQALSVLPAGGERLLKISSRFHSDTNEIHLTFKDNGPGLPADERIKIFEPFFSTKTKGAGIGLALCQDLIAEHGGTIRVESTQEIGAIFTVVLPCYKPTV